MRRIVSITILILMLFSLNCSEFMKRMAVKELQFSLIRVGLIDYNLTDMTLKVDIRATNPNDIDAVIDKLDYTFFINDKSAASGTTAKRVKVTAGNKKTFATELTVNYIGLGTALFEAVKEKRADYKLEGKVYIETSVGSITFPVNLLYP